MYRVEQDLRRLLKGLAPRRVPSPRTRKSFSPFLLRVQFSRAGFREKREFLWFSYLRLLARGGGKGKTKLRNLCVECQHR
jgi:hypothetical protein